MHGMTTRDLRLPLLLAAVALACLLGLALAESAEAFLYWTNSGSGSIGRANNDGSGASQSFITGCTEPLGMAIDAGHIYWSNNATGAIGRANLDGTGVDQAFVTGVQGRVQGISVTEDYIFWVTDSAQVGRANIDGTGVNDRLFTATGESSWDIYARGSYVYWSFLDSKGLHGIHRGNLQGTSQTKNITPYMYKNIMGIWVGPSYIFWGNGQDYYRAVQPTATFSVQLGEAPMSHGLAHDDDDYLYSTWTGGDGLSPGIIRVELVYGDVYKYAIITTAVNGPWDVEADEVTVSSSLADLSARIGQARLPLLLAASLKVKLTMAMAALKSGDARAARAAIDSATTQIRSESGRSIPAQRAAEWLKVLELLRVHVV